MGNDNLPVLAEQPPRTAPWLDDTDTHLLEVTYHNPQDIIVNRDYFILFIEDAAAGRYILSNVSSPITTEKDC